MRTLNKFRKLSFAIVTLTILTVLLYVKPSASQTSFNWKWSPNVRFRLPAYNTVIAFSDYIYLDSFSWDDLNATKITFNHILFNGETEALSTLGLSVENANATIYGLTYDDKLRIVLSAPSGTTSVLTVYYPTNYPPTIDVGTTRILKGDYLTSMEQWTVHDTPAVYLNTSNSYVKVKVTHASDVSITLFWTEPQRYTRQDSGPSPSKLQVNVEDVRLTLPKGTEQTFKLTVHWSGVNDIVITKVLWDTSWLSLVDTLPLYASKTSQDIEGTATITMKITVPPQTTTGQHIIGISVAAQQQSITTITVETNSVIYLTITSGEAATGLTPEIMTYLFLSMVLGLSAYAFIKKR
jgi:hypothetical protein